MEPRRFDLDLGWGTVSCLEWRPEDSSRLAVLLLHGGGVDSAELSWGGVGPELAAAGHRVIAPDHPGFGGTVAPPWTTTQDRLVHYVGEVVDALGLDRYAVGGLSLGGGITIGHALARPQGIAGAMLLGSYGIMDRMTEGPLSGATHLLVWTMLRTGLLDALNRAYAGNRRLLTSSLRAIVRNPEQLTPELVDQVVAASGRPGAFATFEQWQRAEFGWRWARTNYTDRLASFPCPALVVHGDRDTGVPVRRAEEAARLIPDARLVVVEGAGHWVQRDRPDIVLPAMLDFLASLG